MEQILGMIGGAGGGGAAGAVGGLGQLMSMFKKFDKNGDGQVSFIRRRINFSSIVLNLF